MQQQLLRRICDQVEYYMSPENLSRDYFLVGLIDMYFFVPIKFLATFPRLLAITKDLQLITSALQTSAKVEMDHYGFCVRPMNWRYMVKFPTERGFLVMTVAPTPLVSAAIPHTPARNAFHGFPNNYTIPSVYHHIVSCTTVILIHFTCRVLQCRGLRVRKWVSLRAPLFCRR